MRVIAGKYKKSTLKTLDSDSTRPTKDMVKEALFSSILINNESTFLDLFSGSGAIGIEALSRGAKDVVFNDYNKAVVQVIKENLRKFNEDRKVFNLSYDDCLNSLNTKFDFVFIDPPYAFNEYDNIFSLLSKNNLLNKNSIIIVEVKKDRILDINGFSLIKERKYGITKLLYYKEG